MKKIILSFALTSFNLFAAERVKLDNLYLLFHAKNMIDGRYNFHWYYREKCYKQDPSDLGICFAIESNYPGKDKTVDEYNNAVSVVRDYREAYELAYHAKRLADEALQKHEAVINDFSRINGVKKARRVSAIITAHAVRNAQSTHKIVLQKADEVEQAFNLLHEAIWREQLKSERRTQLANRFLTMGLVGLNCWGGIRVISAVAEKMSELITCARLELLYFGPE